MKIAILGAGGHAKVVVDALLAQAPATEIILVADTVANGTIFETLKVMTEEQFFNHGFVGSAHVAIGSQSVRKQLYIKLAAHHIEYATILHPCAILSPFAEVEAGAFIAASAIIAPNAHIGQGVIINHGAIVDHDNTIKAWTHIAPNVTLGGGVSIGESCLIGAGATVLPNISICDNVIIGAGAVVTKNITQPGTYMGAPAALR